VIGEFLVWRSYIQPCEGLLLGESDSLKIETFARFTKKETTMKTISQPAVITPSILILALLAAAVVFIGATGKRVPLLSNTRVDIVLLVILGMSICTQAGIGRIAATGQWSHPLSIVGYILGGLILLITLAVFVGWKLPYIQTDQQALIAIASLAGLKVVNAVTHYLLSRAS
jgi:hypothetical protein